MLAAAGPSSAAARRWQVSAWTFGSRSSLRSAVAAGALDEVQPDWYDAKADGSLAGSVDPAFVQLAHALGVKRVLVTVTNYDESGFDAKLGHAIVASPAARAALVANLVDACATIGYDGVDLDFEGLPAADRDLLSSFVEQLAAGLHAHGLTLGMAVAAKTSEPGDWSGAQSEDYARLGAAVDEFQIMTYDYSGSWSRPGPISPPAWSSRVLTFAETQADPAKIWMGVPFYGGEWWGGSYAERDWRSFAHELARHHAARVTRTRSHEARFTFRDAAGRRHTCYFQDRKAIAAKLDVVRLRHPEIAGIAIWVMGGEDPRFWPLIAARFAAS